MADWLKILKEQRAEGDRTRKVVSRILADPAVGRDQVMALFAALDKQTGFVEKLVVILDRGGYDPDVVRSAERLETLYAELAESVAEKARTMAAAS